MTADYRAQAVEDPTTVILDLYRSHAQSDNFPLFVAEHFSKLFENLASFNKVCIPYGRFDIWMMLLKNCL